MGTKIEIQKNGVTIWMKEDDSIIDPKDISIKFDSGVGNALIMGTVDDIEPHIECPKCGWIKE